jgi:hypothetical protein
MLRIEYAPTKSAQRTCHEKCSKAIKLKYCNYKELTKLSRKLWEEGQEE